MKDTFEETKIKMIMKLKKLERKEAEAARAKSKKPANISASGIDQELVLAGEMLVDL